MTKHPIALFLDSADRDECAPLLATGLFRGVTTNPLILQRAGVSLAGIPEVCRWAGDEGRTLFLQVWGTTLSEQLASADWLLDVAPHAVLKVPCDAVGVRCASVLQERAVPVLLTAVYSATQALLAGALGVEYLAPYVNRMADLGIDAVAELRAMTEVLPQEVGNPLIVAASLKNVAQVGDLVAAGVRSFTLNPPLARKLLANPDTAKAIDEFEAATDEVGRP